MKEFYLNDPIRIDHPLANKISVQDSEYHHCVPGKSSEVAFFVNKKFQTEILKEFAEYADGVEGDTLVYSWVPNELVNEFVEKHSVYL